jgi:hypothetical protein
MGLAALEVILFPRPREFPRRSEPAANVPAGPSH